MAQREYVVDQGEVAAVNGADAAPVEAPAPVPPESRPVLRCEAAGFRSARMTIAAFTELSTTFPPQVAYQTALELTRAVLASPSGAKILEE
jgi:hypothetical protein